MIVLLTFAIREKNKNAYLQVLHGVNLQRLDNLLRRLHQHLDDANVLRRVKVARQDALAQHLVQQRAPLASPRLVVVVIGSAGQRQQRAVCGAQQRDGLGLGRQRGQEKQRREHGLLKDGVDAGRAEDRGGARGEKTVQYVEAALADGNVGVLDEGDEHGDVEGPVLLHCGRLRSIISMRV